MFLFFRLPRSGLFSNTSGFTSQLSGNFTLKDGSITAWTLGGYTGQVGCGGGPGCASGASDAVTTPTFDGADVFIYSNLGESSASNSGGGVWIETPAVPEPSTWAMLLIGFAAIGFAGYRKNLRETNKGLSDRRLMAIL